MRITLSTVLFPWAMVAIKKYKYDQMVSIHRPPAYDAIMLLLRTMVCFDLINSFELMSDPGSVNWTHDQSIYSRSLYQLSYVRALQIGVKYVVQEQ